MCNKGTQAAANMEAYIARIIGKDNFVPGHKPVLQDHKTKKPDNEGEETLRGTVLLKRTARLPAMAKSTRAVVLIPKVVEADTGIQVMPLNITDEDLKAKVVSLGELSLGVVPFKAGCAIATSGRKKKR